MGFHHVGQASLELPTSGDPPALASKVLGLQAPAVLFLFFASERFVTPMLNFIILHFLLHNFAFICSMAFPFYEIFCVNQELYSYSPIISLVMSNMSGVEAGAATRNRPLRHRTRKEEVIY